MSMYEKLCINEAILTFLEYERIDLKTLEDALEVKDTFDKTHGFQTAIVQEPNSNIFSLEFTPKGRSDYYKSICDTAEKIDKRRTSQKSEEIKEESMNFITKMTNEALISLVHVGLLRGGKDRFINTAIPAIENLDSKMYFKMLFQEEPDIIITTLPLVSRQHLICIAQAMYKVNF